MTDIGGYVVIEYLKELIRDKNWTEALSCAVALTNNSTSTLEELTAAYCAMLRARLAIRDYAGARVAGKLATEIAKEQEDWDAYGIACNDLGVTHFMLKEYDSAAVQFNEYLSNVHRYREAISLQVQVWFNLGCVYRASNRGQDAIAALSRGLEQAKHFGDPESLHSIRVTLVDAKLKAGETEQVPRLLAQTGRYLQKIGANNQQLLYYTAYRVEFALLTGRYRRARILASRALLVTEGKSRWQFDFHILLAKVEQALQSWEAAIGHALAAQTCALHCGRSDLDVEASAILQALHERKRELTQISEN
jgi:tetratricopeptide (TPR) repeat protein